MTDVTTSDVIIIGAGVIGLATAWRAAAAGLTVTIADPAPGGGATGVAAGMLTPVTELAYGEEPLLRLGLASRDRYARFVAELESLTGEHVGLRDDGLLQVAFDSGDLAHLDELRVFQESLGLRVDRLTGRECRRLEPLLAPSVRGGLLAPRDGSVDPRRLTTALLAAVRRTGGTLVRERVAEVLVEHDAAVGVRLADGTPLRAPKVLLAAGAWSGGIGGLPPGAVPPVRPVKGQVLRLRGRTPLLTRPVRGMVKGSPVYLVPRADGELVVGATQEEMGFDVTVTAGGLWELLRDARELLPGVTELEFAEVSAGLRPGSPDNAPVLGRAALAGLYLATGHFRGGVLLAPATADAMTEVLCGRELPPEAAPLAAARFDTGQRDGRDGRDERDERTSEETACG